MVQLRLYQEIRTQRKFLLLSALCLPNLCPHSGLLWYELTRLAGFIPVYMCRGIPWEGE